jgi:DNA-binding CsgD family transcriptional regulator
VLLERARELAAIDAVLAEDAGLVLFEGRPGYGKTALLDVAAERAEAAGLIPLRAGGAELEQGRGLELVARLLGERFEELASAYEALPADAVLVIDDLQWADAQSLEFVDFVLQRGQHRIVAAGLPPSPARLAAQAREVIELAPLSDDAAATIAADEMVAECGGNPRLLAGGAIEPWVELRLSRLDDRARSAAAAIAVLGDEHATTGHVAAVCALQPPDVAVAADALIRAGFVAAGDPIRFAEPAVAAAVLATLPAPHAAQLRLDTARVLAADEAPAETIGSLLLGAPRLGETPTVRMLGAAAEAAAARGDHGAVAAYTQRALEEPPPPAERAELTMALAEAEAMAGSLGALDRFESALQLARKPDQRARALTTLAWRLYQAGRPSDARLAFEHALAEPELDDELRTEASIAGRVLGAFDGTWDADAMRAFAMDAAQSGEIPADKRAVLLAVAAVFGDADANVAQAAAMNALAAVGQEESGLNLLIGTCAMSALIWSDALDAVEPMFPVMIRAAETRRDPHLLAYMRFGRSWGRYWRGDVRGAADDVMFAVDSWVGDWNAQLYAGAWWAARCLVELGEPDEARAVLERASGPSGIPDPVRDGYLAAGSLHVATATGRWKQARQDIAVLQASGGPWFEAASVLEWQVDAAIALARGGERDRAQAFAEQHLAAARQFGAPRTLGTALRALAIVEDSERSLELLAEAVGVLEQSPSRLELIRALVDQGALLRSLGKRSHARAALKRALEEAGPTSADALRERARAELAMTGGAPGGERLTGPEALTPSERRVVELAAAGRSNPDIAAELFVSRKTVEFHLSNAFRKLAVGSRDELLQALGRS